MSAPHFARPTRALALLATSALLTTGCFVLEPFSAARDSDPTVQLRTSETGELGVSTDYGVVFLGRDQKSGEVEFSAWFGDGPSLETGIVEALGDGLFVTRAEIVLPIVPIRFDARPAPGDQVVVRGRRGAESYRIDARVASDPSVDGILLRANSALDALSSDQHGAGVYVRVDGALQLVGLVTGSLRLGSRDDERAYYTVLGPDVLWRLVAHRRDADQPRRVPQRGDVTL